MCAKASCGKTSLRAKRFVPSKLGPLRVADQLLDDGWMTARPETALRLKVQVNPWITPPQVIESARKRFSPKLVGRPQEFEMCPRRGAKRSEGSLLRE